MTEFRTRSRSLCTSRDKHLYSQGSGTTIRLVFRQWDGKMDSKATDKFLTRRASLLFAGWVLSGCMGDGNGARDLEIAEPRGVWTTDPVPAASDSGIPVAPELSRSGVADRDPDYYSRLTGGAVVSSEQPTHTPERSARAHTPNGVSIREDHPSSARLAETLSGTQPRSLRLSEQPRANPMAADLLDGWGHRRVQGLVEGLSLGTAEHDADDADLEGLRTAAQAAGRTPVVPDLQNDDDVRILGSRHGVTYGRWTGGPADTLSIEFDLSGAGPLMRDDSAFRAMLERAGKAWSRRIPDTWTAWEREEDDLKGFLVKDVDPGIQVRVGEGGEISTGLEVDVRDEDLDGANAWSLWGRPVPGHSWQPRFGSVEVDREYLRETYEARLYSTLTHEIGHTLGAWREKRPGVDGDDFPYTDRATGTWTGPNVVAIHGGPAPFREKSPSVFDFKHSGVCTSIMAYCRHDQAIRPLGPQAIDFAFLADLGLTVTEETDRPETYGLAGWTGHAGFTLSVSRDLRVDWADLQPHVGNDDYHWQELEFTDLLSVGVDAFGRASTGNPRLSHAEETPYGTARYVGGLVGAALYRPGLPPVTGNATLAIDLDSLDGRASFTSLLVYPAGEHEIFGSGSLHYPFEVSANALVGTDTRSALNASFFGPGHEEAAGTLRDPRAGLLASFGTTVDQRPSREDVIAGADYIVGMARRFGATDSSEDGWHVYRCNAVSSCESRYWSWQAGAWTSWTATERQSVLAETAGWNWKSTARPDREFGFARVSRHFVATTDGAHGRRLVDGYTGTLEYAGFGAGIETTSSEWADPAGPPPGFEHLWVGFQGARSGSSPDATATWSGRMLGYDRGSVPKYQDPFVEGLATVTYSLPDDEVDVVFSEIASRDGLRSVDDFGFENVEVRSDGTFRQGELALSGAFFGSSNEEVAGQFDNNNPRVLGSFGARRSADDASPSQDEVDTALKNIVETEDGLRVGADVAPPSDRLAERGDYNGVSVSSFVPDAANEDLLAEDMGPWNDFSLHLAGGLGFVGGTTTFGIAYGDELVEPWASGPEPLADLADNSALSGTTSWNGALLGMSTSHEVVSGRTNLVVDMSTLQGELRFIGLEHWGGEIVPGDVGTGTMWGDGVLEYSVSVHGNSFVRTSGDDGEIIGSFFGISHQATGGVLERSDLRAGFGGTR